MARYPLEIPSRKCQGCGFLYHPTGTGQRFCVRPFCLEQRGRPLDDYLAQDEPRPRVLGPDRRLLPDEVRARLQAAQKDLTILAGRPETQQQRAKLRQRIRCYRARLATLDDFIRL